MMRSERRRRPIIAASSAVIAVGLDGIAQAEQHTFELNAPDAHYVYLAGEMTQWEKSKLPMRMETDGKWRVTVDLGRGEWLYKFIVDGKWIADPASPAHDADGMTSSARIDGWYRPYASVIWNFTIARTSAHIPGNTGVTTWSRC